MKLLLITHEENDPDQENEKWVICPFCSSALSSEDAALDTEHYVLDNCALYCQSCGTEMLLCLSSDQLDCGRRKTPFQDCSKIISQEMAEKLYPNLGIFMAELNRQRKVQYCDLFHDSEVCPQPNKFCSNPQDVNENCPLANLTYKQIAALEITHVISDGYDADVGDVDDGTKQEKSCRLATCYHHLEKPEMVLKKIPFPTNHGGNTLYYKAKCTECHLEFESEIWGD
jgi:hypothetical protein